MLLRPKLANSARMMNHSKIKAGFTALALATATAVATATAPLAAQEQAGEAAAPASQQPERPQAINRFDPAIIQMLLQDLGTRVQLDQGQDGVTRYRASADGGINFTAFPAACSDETGCVGLITVAIYSGLEIPADASLDDFLNRFNDANPSAKVFRTPANEVVIQSYINAANVITYRNALSQLLVFGRDVLRARQSLAEFQNQG